VEIRYHYILYGIFAVCYWFITGLHNDVEDYEIAIKLGVLIIITGLWGLLVKEVLLKLPHSVQKYSLWINIVIITLGTIFLIDGINKLYPISNLLVF